MLNKLVSFSNHYGKNPELVLAGGGNTSAKNNGVMYVKGSGTSLATITAEQFVKIDLEKLNKIFEKTYPETDDEREALVLADLMASRAEGEESKRPSVETTLHALFEQTFVLHLHPALVNGLTCSNGGEKLAAELFGDSFIWIDACRPGYILAKLCSDKMKEYKQRKGVCADIIILQNHGIFIADDTVEGLDLKLSSVMEKLENHLDKKPDTSSVEAVSVPELSFASAVEHIANADCALFSADSQSAKILMKPFTPDHIVYCKAYPLFVGKGESAKEKYDEYIKAYIVSPRIVIIEGKGIFAIGADAKQAATAKLLFEDAVKIAVYTESFGGALHMSEELTDFIVNWEVESYRSSQNK